MCTYCLEPLYTWRISILKTEPRSFNKIGTFLCALSYLLTNYCFRTDVGFGKLLALGRWQGIECRFSALRLHWALGIAHTSSWSAWASQHWILIAVSYSSCPIATDVHFGSILLWRRHKKEKLKKSQPDWPFLCLCIPIIKVNTRNVSQAGFSCLVRSLTYETRRFICLKYSIICYDVIVTESGSSPPLGLTLRSQSIRQKLWFKNLSSQAKYVQNWTKNSVRFTFC